MASATDISIVWVSGFRSGARFGAGPTQTGCSAPSNPAVPATTGSETFTTTAVVGSNVGSYAVNGSGLAANHGNYVFAQAAGNATALTINPATLTVTANAAGRIYGAADPAFSGSVTGFVAGDTLGSATAGSEVVTTTAVANGNVGSYAVTGTGLTVNNGNYVFA